MAHKQCRLTVSVIMEKHKQLQKWRRRKVEERERLTRRECKYRTRELISTYSLFVSLFTLHRAACLCCFFIVHTNSKCLCVPPAPLLNGNEMKFNSACAFLTETCTKSSNVIKGCRTIQNNRVNRNM